MIKHHKYKNSRWSQNPGAGRARVHCTSLPCPPTPPKPVGKSRRAAGTAHGHVPICGCCGLPLRLQGLPGGEKKKNVQRAREREKGEKNARSQQLPNNWHFCFLELLLGARNLAGLPVEHGVNASPQPDFCGRRLLRSAFLSGRAIKAQQLSLLSFCSY